MNTKKIKIRYLVTLLLLFTMSLSGTLLSRDLTTKTDASKDMGDDIPNKLDDKREMDDRNIENADSSDQSRDTGYSTSDISKFDTIERAESQLAQRDFKGFEYNPFNISTPKEWNLSSLDLNLETYQKNQTIRNPYFDSEDYWELHENQNAQGTIEQEFEPEANPEHVITNLYHSEMLFDQTAFLKNDYGLYTQDLQNLNPENLEIAQGELFQDRDQKVVGSSFESNPGFFKDYNNPYGGVDRTGDEVNLNYYSENEGFLRVNINPGTGQFRGNPSAAWWGTFDLPYEIDYAQLSLSWSISSASNFEAKDNYRVNARINNKYIDGVDDLVSGDPSPRNINGSETALLVYDKIGSTSHDIITRTYNITRQIDGLVGMNKFDFGGWARNPSEGDEDNMILDFHSIELLFNVSKKYEIGQVEFDYKAINNIDGSIINPNGNEMNDPNRIINNASIFLLLNNDSNIMEAKRFRMEPFNNFNFSEEDSNSKHIKYSISQQYKSILQNDHLYLGFGVVFETNYGDPIDLDLIFDNFTFTINYKHPDVNYSEMEIKVGDDGIWEDLAKNELSVNISDWNSGENHSIYFKSENSTFGDILYLNIISNLRLNFTRYGTERAQAKYLIDEVDSAYGYWNISYDNSQSYSLLTNVNATPFFNLSQYNMSFIDLPAFDGLGANSKNWEIFRAFSPFGENFTDNLSTFNYSTNDLNQSSKIQRAFRAGIWQMYARQANYITANQLNATSNFQGVPVFYRDSFLEYNFTLKNDSLNDYAGYYNISIFNESGAMLNSFPEYYSSSSKYLTGTLEISTDYEVGIYYLMVRWNDTDTSLMRTLRFGSDILQFYVVNATEAGFIEVEDPTINIGDPANFSAYYRTIYGEGWGINTSNVLVYENSSSNWRLWGKQWTGAYQVDTEYLGDGNYTYQLDTRGAPNGSYHLLFTFYKNFNQKQNLTAELQIIATFQLNLDIMTGAYFENNEWILNESNIPYVNDTVNSVLQLNLTKESDGTALSGGSIVGKIGDEGVFTDAIDLGEGIYNLTLDTTGLNATELNQNKTLTISYSADGYVTDELNVTVFIDKIPTAINLQQIDSTYEKGGVTITAIMNNYITPEDPNPNNNAILRYKIYNGSNLKKNGYLDFFSNGVYTKDIILNDLKAGEYNVFVNGTAFNCQSSVSINRTLTVISQLSTDLDIQVPEEIRILKEFEIRTTLLYENGSAIPDQTINLNITIQDKDSFIITTTTDQDGISRYDYLVSSADEGKWIQINATFEGEEQIGGSNVGINQTIEGKYDVFLDIIDYPNNTARVGYSATYRVSLNITDPEINNQKQSILLTAYYDGDITAIFVSTQLTTDKNGECEYTIEQVADGKDNMTVYFEYLGSDTVQYGFTNRTDNIIPKWPVNYVYEDLPDIIRFGQLITFHMDFWSPENSTLLLEGLKVIFRFEYGDIIETYDDFVNENNSLVFDYQIADSFSGNLNISITFTGNSQIASNSTEFSMNIEEKIKINLQFEEQPNSQYYTGTHFISVKVSDEEGNPIENLNILFLILDSDGTIVYNISAETNEKGIASASLEFSDVGDNYKLRIQFTEEGIYAGSVLEQENIRIVNEFIVFLDLLPFIILGIAIISAVSYAYYRGYIIPKRRKRQEALKQLYQKLEDVENIQYILIITKDGGVPCFSKSLADVPIDESLVSGFLSAISSFGAEIGSKMKKEKTKGGLEEASYRQFKIILDEGAYVRTALLLKKRSSVQLKAKLKEFNAQFESKFKDRLKHFNGQVFKEMVVMKIVEEVFEADLLYPHQVVENKVEPYIKSVSKKDLRSKILLTAKGEDFESNFYIRNMINFLKINGIEEIKSFNAINQLKKDNLVFAINPRTNYLIEQLKPYLNALSSDDKNILIAIDSGATDDLSIRKYLNKQNIEIEADISSILVKLKELELIQPNNQISDTGAAVVTILELIPDI